MTATSFENNTITVDEDIITHEAPVSFPLSSWSLSILSKNKLKKSLIVFDLNLKYKGFSLLFEYADSYASGLEDIYTDPNGFNTLIPKQISKLGKTYRI